MMESSRIRSIEERAFNAWPALQTLALGGWLLNLSGSYTRRANSISALAPSVPFQEVQQAAEAVFARHHLQATFRLSSLAAQEADFILHEAGYRSLDPSLVMTTAIESHDSPGAVRIAEAPEPDWLHGFALAAAINSTHHSLHDAMISKIALPAAFATVREGGEPVAFGRGVYERGMIGIFDVIVAQEQRRRGHGRSITQALLSWGRRIGATEAYLQVNEHNEAARHLYADLGFGESYHYHYRQRVS